jgi:hypothetical protein
MAEEKPVIEPPPAAPVVVPPVVDETKKYTDKDVNDIVAKGKAEAVSAALKELGIASTEDAKKNLAALKAWQDSQKTETQKAADLAKEAVDGRTAAERRADIAEMKVEALAAGVGKDMLDDLITLAEKEEGKTIAEKVKAAIDKRPWLKGADKPGEFGAKIKGQAPDEKAQAQAAVNAAFGIKAKQA